MAAFVFFVAFVLMLGLASALGLTVDSREAGSGFFASPRRPRNPDH